MIIEGAGSGSISLTSGSGSGSRGHKNMCNRWIQIRIRIHNTVYNILCMMNSIPIRIRIKKSRIQTGINTVSIKTTSITGFRTTFESLPVMTNIKAMMNADSDPLKIRIRIKKSRIRTGINTVSIKTTSITGFRTTFESLPVTSND